jgi:glycosyltransferase involved in cell wall biosynthesis
MAAVPLDRLQVAFTGRCLVNHLARGGIGVYAHELARFLGAHLPPERLRIFVPERAPAPAGIDPAFLDRVPCVFGERLRRRPLAIEFVGQMAMLHAARRRFPQGVTYVPDAPAWSPLRPRRLVVTCYDLIHLTGADTERSRLQRWRLRLGDRFTRGADRIVTISGYSRGEIVAAWPETAPRVEVIYPLACADTLAPTPPRPVSAWADRLPAGPYWVYFGGYNPRKGVPFLFDAYAEARRRAPGGVPPLVAVGLVDGAGRLRVDAGVTAVPEGVIGLPGLTRAELIHVVSGAVFSPYPSELEGFGLPPYEAMLRGVAVLVGDNSSLREVVPRAACRLPARDREAWVAALVWAAREPQAFRCPCPPELERAPNERAFLEVLARAQAA